MSGAEINVSSLLLLQGRPCGGESDSQIVSGAWDFKRINNRYQQHLKILAERPEVPLRTETAAAKMRDWAAVERKAWLRAVSTDPLLPEQLIPSSYLGKECFRQRMQAFSKAYSLFREFKA